MVAPTHLAWLRALQGMQTTLAPATLRCIVEPQATQQNVRRCSRDARHVARASRAKPVCTAMAGPCTRPPGRGAIARTRLCCSGDHSGRRWPSRWPAIGLAWRLRSATGMSLTRHTELENVANLLVARRRHALARRRRDEAYRRLVATILNAEVHDVGTPRRPTVWGAQVRRLSEHQTRAA